MSFHIDSDHINLNLSNLAKKIIEQDLIIFNASLQSNMVLGRLINNIIENYSFLEDFEISKNFISIKDKGSYFKIRLNSAVIEKINSLSFLDENEIISEICTNSVPLYVKAVLEGYARSPFIKREQVVLRKVIIDIINNSILKTKQLRITTYNDECIISPLKIESSKEGAFQYLVGIDSKKQLQTIRLSKIKKILAMGKATKLSIKEQKEINERLAEFGPTFAPNEIITIKVKLTPIGVESYKYSVIHRPIHKTIEDDNIFVFECSEMQAIYFFFRFAGEAEILEPISLRNKFKALYSAGLDANS